MTRNEKILAYINKNGHGIEIGPSHAPIAPKKDGYLVDIVDHMSREDLLAKYQNHNINLGNIEEVDYVWSGQTYAELTGKPKHYDWIIASHVIEHTPDLIDFLINCDDVLKDEGVLSLVIPDKRYCFDHFRPITGIAKIIDSHFAAHKIHTAGSVAEHFLTASVKDGELGWHAHSPGEFKLAHSLVETLQHMDKVNLERIYVDLHAWCFVPHSFRLLIYDLNALGLIALKEVDFQPTDGYEFYVTLGRNGVSPSLSRLELLEKIALEMQDLPPPPVHVSPSIHLLPPSFARRVYRRLKRSFNNLR